MAFGFLKKDKTKKKLVLDKEEQAVFDAEQKKLRKTLLKDLAKKEVMDEFTPRYERIGATISRKAVGAAKAGGAALDWIAGKEGKINVRCVKCGSKGTRENLDDLRNNNKCKKCGGYLEA